MTNIQHGEETTTRVFYGGEVTNERKQLKVSLFTTDDMMLKEVIDALALLKRGETNKLDISLQIDNKNRVKMVKIWQI